VRTDRATKLEIEHYIMHRGGLHYNATKEESGRDNRERDGISIARGLEANILRVRGRGVVYACEEGRRAAVRLCYTVTGDAFAP